MFALLKEFRFWLAVVACLAGGLDVTAQTIQPSAVPVQPSAVPIVTGGNGEWANAVTPNPVGQNYLQPSACNCQQCTTGCGGDDQVWATVTPYLWLPAMKGQIGAGAVVANVDLSLSDMWDLLGDLKGAAMVHLEIGRGNRGGLILDTLLTDIASTETLPSGGTATVETTMTFLEGLGFRPVATYDKCGPLVKRVSWDMLYGVRYYQIGAEVTVVPPSAPEIIQERSENWVDLVLGTRTRMQLANGGSAFARAEFGGFGLGSSSDFAWNFHVGLENRLRRHPNTSLALGYKVLDIKQSKGSGAQAFLFDMNLHGPFTGLMIRF
ncbi:MAG: hypothetical protein ACK48X_07245 [Planctomycetota bacterium]